MEPEPINMIWYDKFGLRWTKWYKEPEKIELFLMECEEWNATGQNYNPQKDSTYNKIIRIS